MVTHDLVGSSLRGDGGRKNVWKGVDPGSIDNPFKKCDHEEMREVGRGRGEKFRQRSVHIIPFLRNRAGLNSGREGLVWREELKI